MVRQAAHQLQAASGRWTSGRDCRSPESRESPRPLSLRAQLRASLELKCTSLSGTRNLGGGLWAARPPPWSPERRNAEGESSIDGWFQLKAELQIEVQNPEHLKGLVPPYPARKLSYIAHATGTSEMSLLLGHAFAVRLQLRGAILSACRATPLQQQHSDCSRQHWHPRNSVSTLGSMS